MGHGMVGIGDGKMLVFGGRSLLNNSVVYLRDTWIYDTATSEWELVTNDGPAARSQHALASDPVRGRVLLFGGYVGSSFTYGDTWLFDVGERTWRRVDTRGGPSGRAGSVAVFDESAGEFVMFGGAEEPPAAELPLAETWVFDPVGELWSQRFTNQVPTLLSEGHPTLFELAMVYDPIAQHSILMVAGESTWIYDANLVVWAKVDPTESQGLAADYMMAATYDARLRRTIAYGGAPTERTAATWAYDSGSDTWTELDTGASSPGPLANHAMAYDSATGRTYLFGGATSVLTLETQDPVTNGLLALEVDGWRLLGP